MDAVILALKTVDLAYYQEDWKFWSVRLSIQQEAMGVAQVSPQGKYYRGDDVYFIPLLKLKKV